MTVIKDEKNIQNGHIIFQGDNMRSSVTKACDTGPVEIDVDIVCRLFKPQKLRKGSERICSESFINKYHDEYTLCDMKNMSIGFKAQLKKEDALAIIEKLKLREEVSVTFNHASTFRL